MSVHDAMQEVYNNGYKKGKFDTIAYFLEKVLSFDYDDFIKEWTDLGDIYYTFSYDEFEKRIDNLAKEAIKEI